MIPNKLYRILLSRDEQLHNQFLDLFTKHVVNSTQSVFFDHFKKDKLQIPYGEVYKFLKAHPEEDRLKSTNRLNSPYKHRNINNFFAFQACNSSITLLLDLSPYMLNYQYQSKSTPLINLQMVVKDLLLKIKQKKQLLIKMYKNMQQNYKDYDWNVQFRITVYIFSVYQTTPITVLYRQDINYTSLSLLADFIINAIHKSNLPYQKKNSKYTIGEIVQKILDSQEPLLGIRSVLVLSSFNQKQPSNKIFFTSNWYTYGFINVGTHMGSYLIDEKQVLQRYGSSTFFQIKYVFSCQFIENWEKVDKIESFKNNFLTLKTQKHRTILFSSQGKTYKNIFNDLLQFKLHTKKKSSANSLHDFAQAQNTSMKFLQFSKKQYKISQWNFNFILRTRYQQGWQPLIHQKKQDKVTKCVFKLDFSPYVCLIYKAQLMNSNQGQFYFIQIGSKLTNQANIRRYKSSLDGLEGKQKEKIFDLIQYIDLICTSKYKSIHTNLLDEIGLKRKQYLSPFSLSQQFQTKSLRYLLNNSNQWGKFSKLKYLYFNFSPRLTRNLLQQFLSEIGYFLGQKISQSIFMKKGWDKEDKILVKQHKIQFSQLIRKNNMIKIKLAFVNYSFKQIKNLIEPFINKFETKKFKSGQTIIISDQLFKFNDFNEITYEKMFQNKWKLKIKDEQTYKAFVYYFKAVLKSQGFDQIGEKRATLPIKTYAKRILINQVKQQLQSSDIKVQNGVVSKLKQKQAQKNLFCNIELLSNSQLIFTFSMFPLVGKLCAFEQESKLYQSPNNLNNLIENKEIKPVRNEITAFEFFFRFTENLRLTQMKIIKVIQNYNQIHQLLLKKVTKNKSFKKAGKGFNHQLKELIKKMYNFKGNNFQTQYQQLCLKIVQLHYDKQNDERRKQASEQYIVIDCIPQPQNFFIEADVPDIKGDLNIKQNGKQYIFFLLSPYHPIYIQKRKNKFYYKSINLLLEQINIQEGDIQSLKIMVNRIGQIIQKEEYRRLYSQFFISPQNFKQSQQKSEEKYKPLMPQKQVNFQILTQKIKKFNPPIQRILDLNQSIELFGVKFQQKAPSSSNKIDESKQMALNLQIQQKISPIVKQFVGIYFQIINQFFDRKMDEYYFQKKYSGTRSQIKKFCLQIQKMTQFNKLILRNYLKTNTQEIPINQQNFLNILFKYKNDIINNKAKVIFLCYSQLDEDGAKHNETFNYFLTIIGKLCLQFSKQLQRVRICKQQDLQKISKNQAKFFTQKDEIQFSSFYDKISREKLIKYIECSMMQRHIYFKKIASQIYEYVAVIYIKNTKQGLVLSSIPFWLTLQIGQSKVQILFSENQFFQRGQKIKTKIQRYKNELINYINTDILINQLSYNRQLPLQPVELFVSEIVNNPNNKLIETKKKKEPKKGLKGIRGRMQSQKKQHLKTGNIDSISINKSNPLPLISKRFILLYERLKNGQGLQAIKKFQNFQIFQIMNLKYTYLLPTAYENSTERQNLIYHFEEDDFQKVSKQISHNQLAQFSGKPKRVLIYYVYGLNSDITKSVHYNFVDKSIKQAINIRTFQTISHQLFLSPQTIQPIEHRQLKKGAQHSFSFQIPFIPFVDDFRGYLKQHLSMYHTKTELKSQKKFHFKKNSNNNDDDFKVQRSQSISQKLSFPKFQDTELKDRSFKESFSQQIQVSNTLYSESFRDHQRQTSTSFNVFEDRRKGVSFGGRFQGFEKQIVCDRCIPTMWLFNYKKNLKLQSKFGRCIYLLKIQIQNNVSTAQNAHIWERVMGTRKKRYYIGSPLSDSQKTLIKQYLSGAKVSKVDPEQNIYKTTITFNILNCLGHPIKGSMSQVFNSIIRTSVSDYYIQNCINEQKLIKQRSKNLEQRPSFVKQSLSLQLSLQDLNLQKTKSEAIINKSIQKIQAQYQPVLSSRNSQMEIQSAKFSKHHSNKESFIDHSQQKLIKKIIQQSQCIDKVIQLSSNQSLFKIVSDQDILVKSIKVYFKDFYEYLNKILQQFFCRHLLFIYYIQFKNSSKQPIYFIDQIEENSIDNPIKKIVAFVQKLQKNCPDSLLSEVKKIGFIGNDQFYEYIQIHKLNKKHISLSSPEAYKLKYMSLQDIERCKIFLEDKSFCLSDYYFTRNMYIHFEISEQCFKYYSYNVNIFVNNRITDFLTPLQVWLHQKYRLLKFIKGIKQKDVYEFLSYNNKKANENKFGFIFQLYLQSLKGSKKQEDDKRAKFQQVKDLTLSKILVGLVFNEYPFKYKDGSLMNLSRQIKDIFQMLKNNPVNYKQMVCQYKGKEKFLLQKLGREYISLLRSNHGYKSNEKMSKTSSMQRGNSIISN